MYECIVIVSKMVSKMSFTHQAALQMKSQGSAATPVNQAELQHDLDLSPDVDIEALIGDTINIDR